MLNIIQRQIFLLKKKILQINFQVFQKRLKDLILYVTAYTLECRVSFLYFNNIHHIILNKILKLED